MRLVNFVVIVFFNNVPVVPVVPVVDFVDAARARHSQTSLSLLSLNRSVPWFYMGSGIGPMPMHDVVVMAVRNAVKWKPPPSLPL